MLLKLWREFKDLRPPVRALVTLSWVYFFSGSLLDVFLQVYLYESFSSLLLNVIATLVMFTGIMVGFVVCGYLASIFRINIQSGFALSFFATAVSVPLLLMSTGATGAYCALFLNGIGQGLFWLTIHTFELTETANHERDFYSSVLSGGAIFLDLLGPAVATAFLVISAWLGLGTYTLLFVFIPFVYLLGLPQFRHIRRYQPERVVWHDIRHFITDRRNMSAQPYLAGSGAYHFLATLVPPLVAFSLLGSAFSVGVYSSLLAVFSAVCVLVLATVRTEKNRLPILVTASVLLAVYTAFVGFEFTLTTFVLYSIALGVLNPIISVSAHVIDLQTMESVGRPKADFYATMLLRDFSLWVWRFVVALIFLIALSFGLEGESLLSFGLYVTALALLLRLFGAVVLVRSTTS
jgi:hypothetical protein